MRVAAERPPHFLLGLRRQLDRFTNLTRSGVAHAPLSIAFLVLMWVVAAATRGIVRGPSESASHVVALGLDEFGDGRIWTVITAGVFGSSLADYVLCTVLVLVFAAPIESRIGSRRFAVAAVLTQALGSLLGLGLAWVFSLGHSQWGQRLHTVYAVGPTIWIVGVIMVATATMPTLWRRAHSAGTDGLARHACLIRRSTR